MKESEQSYAKKLRVESFNLNKRKYDKKMGSVFKFCMMTI